MPRLNKADNTMRAAKLYGARDFRIEDVPEPGIPGSGEVVVRVGSVGVVKG